MFGPARQRLQHRGNRRLRSPRRRRRGGLLACVGLWLALGMVIGCQRPPFAPKVTRGQNAAAESDAVDAVGQPAGLDALGPTRVVSLETGSKTPTPSFSLDGSTLFYRLEAGSHRNHDKRSEVRGLDLRDLENTLFFTFKETGHTLSYDPYAYGSGAANAVPTIDVAFHPIGASRHLVVAGSEALADPNDVVETWRLSLETSRSSRLTTDGTFPTLSPDGSRLFVQSRAGLVEVDLAGQRKGQRPGFFPVFSPDDDRYLVHATPFVAPVAADYVAYPEPYDEYPPLAYDGDLGGLILVVDDEERRVTDYGGRPSWHPDGDRFVYERPRLPSATDPSEKAQPAPEAPDGGSPAAGPEGGEEEEPIVDRAEAPPEDELAEIDALGGAVAQLSFTLHENDLPLDIVLHRLDTNEDTLLARDGRFASYHASGAFVVFERDGHILVTDGDEERALGMEGTNPRLDPLGQYLVVEVEHSQRRGPSHMDLEVYALFGSSAVSTTE